MSNGVGTKSEERYLSVHTSSLIAPAWEQLCNNNNKCALSCARPTPTQRMQGQLSEQWQYTIQAFTPHEKESLRTNEHNASKQKDGMFKGWKVGRKDVSFSLFWDSILRGTTIVYRIMIMIMIAIFISIQSDFWYYDIIPSYIISTIRDSFVTAFLERAVVSFQNSLHKPVGHCSWRRFLNTPLIRYIHISYLPPSPPPSIQ